MSATSDTRQATIPVLVIVTLISAAILLLGDRFDTASGHVLTKPVPAAPIAACVAEESMRLINADREQCHPGELLLVEAPVPGSVGDGRYPPMR